MTPIEKLRETVLQEERAVAHRTDGATEAARRCLVRAQRDLARALDHAAGVPLLDESGQPITELSSVGFDVTGAKWIHGWCWWSVHQQTWEGGLYLKDRDLAGLSARERAAVLAFRELHPYTREFGPRIHAISGSAAA